MPEWKCRFGFKKSKCLRGFFPFNTLLLFSLSAFHLRALNVEVHTHNWQRNARMKPLFVNFFGKMEWKKSFHLFFVVINMRFILFVSTIEPKLLFHRVSTRSFSHVTGHEKLTKPNTLTPTRTRSTAPTQQHTRKKTFFVVRFYRYASRVRQ